MSMVQFHPALPKLIKFHHMMICPYSSVVEHSPDKGKVDGSSPSMDTKNNGLDATRCGRGL